LTFACGPWAVLSHFSAAVNGALNQRVIKPVREILATAAATRNDDDFTRQRVLEDHGETVIRTTWVEVVTKPGAVVRRVRQVLTPERRGSGG
jgi:very-short-patch-repair endonuclease